MRPRITMSTRRLFVFVVGSLAMFAAACGEKLPQDALAPHGPVARQENRLWLLVFPIAIAMFVLVEGLILFVIFRYRARSDDDRPVQIHGHARLELTWTVVPALILAVCGVFTLATIVQINKRAEGADVVNVKVIGHQWWWEFQYPAEKIVTANELHIPAGRKVELEMTSQDVIHSFWPPALAGKVDVVPGRINRMQIEADKPGTYFGQCAEYCGLSHANMHLRVVAHNATGWDAWVQGQQQPAATPAAGSLAAEGAALVQAKGCVGCHSINGLEGANGKVGPNLTHLQSREKFAGASFDLNARNLRKWLRDPPGMKPMVPANGQGMPNLGLTEDEITKLIAYLETLK